MPPSALTSTGNKMPTEAKGLSWCSKERLGPEEEARRQRRDGFEKAVSERGDALLDSWEKYLTWTDKTEPGEGMSALLCRCVRSLASERKFRNELKSLIVVITFVDTCAEVSLPNAARLALSPSCSWASTRY